VNIEGCLCEVKMHAVESIDLKSKWFLLSTSELIVINELITASQKSSFPRGFSQNPPVDYKFEN
jgi:hypothetical protein